MSKKEGDRTICRYNNKRAQITIFMIVGLVILFVFLFLITLSNSLKKSQLEQAQEEVYSKAFKKEAMRIYVEDCLNDELEKALILLGKQGRIWDDQPGGTKTFTNNVTGLTSLELGDRINYGISREEYFSEENAYPCQENKNKSPEFCQYQFPQTNLGFGELSLKTSTLKTDLQRYLINRTIWCVTNYTKSNISQKAEIEPAKINLKLDILNDGIDIKAEYPLKFKVGQEEFFHLSVFDFFYPTQFKWMLESAVVRPLFYDWKYLDFNYTENTLTKNTFNYASNHSGCDPYSDHYLCEGTLFLDKYQSLGIEMNKKELGNGDDLFIFKSPKILNLPGFYEFRTIRQNRQPALDYVSREACPEMGYDYLVIIGDNSSDKLGEINLTLFALDPDEDNVSYLMEYSGNTQTNPYFIDQEKIENDFTPGKYELLATVTDQHGLSDWQNVRFLVDRPLEINFTLSLPYIINGFPYNDLMSINYFTISNEDPIFLNITYPKDSVTKIKPSINLQYLSLEENFEINMFNQDNNYQDLAGKEFCLNLPFSQNDANCKLSAFTDKIEKWPERLTGDYFLYPYFKENSLGKLNVSFSVDYCGINRGNSKTINLRVAECIPHSNPNHPFPFPYENVKVNQTTGEYSEEEINPFLATHACCNPADWNVYEEDQNVVCYQGVPELGCFGGSKEAEGFGSGYLLEQETLKRYCDGERGNICNGKSQKEWLSLGICGNNSFANCNSVPSECQNKNPYYLGESSSGSWYWCDGDLGCGRNRNVCNTVAVDVNSDGKFSQGDLCGVNNCQYEGQKCLDLINKKEGVCQAGASTSEYQCV